MPTPSYTQETLKASLPGPTFDTKACKTKYPTPRQFSEDSGKFLKAMGMDQKCKQGADEQYKNLFEEHHESEKAGGVGLFGGFGLTNDSGGTKINQTHSDHKTSEGCSQALANISKQMSNTNSITCSLNQISRQTSTSMSSSAKITIDASLDPLQLQSMLGQLETVKGNMPKAAIIPPPPDYSTAKTEDEMKFKESGYKIQIEALRKSHQEDLDTWRKMVANINASIDKGRGGIKVTGSNFKNYVGGEVGISKVSTTASTQAVKEDIKKATRAALEQHLTNSLGVNTNAPDLKTAIDNMMEENQNSVANSINTTDDQVSVDVKNSSEILIKTGGSTIEISDTTFDQHMEVNLKTRQMMQNAMDNGKQMAMVLTSDLAAKQAGDTTVKGNEEILKAMNDAIKASTDGITKQLEAQAKLSEAGGKFVSDIIGSITSMFSMVLLLPLIAIGALLFGAPMLGFSLPKPLKYALIAIVIYLVVAYFLGLPPFSHSDTYTVTMKEINSLEKKIYSMLEEFDENDDGYLSEDEFLRGVKEKPELMYDAFDALQNNFRDDIKAKRKLYGKVLQSLHRKDA